MQGNPISAIENAELMAKQTVQKANEDKNSLIRKAREEAGLNLAEAIQKAQTESDRMIREAEKSSRTDIAASDSEFEKEKADLLNKASARENEVAGAIIEIISEKTT